jgi:hypothetical protein
VHLHDNIDQRAQQGADVMAVEIVAALGFLDEEGELFERALGVLAWTVVIEPGWPLLTLRR